MPYPHSTSDQRSMPSFADETIPPVSERRYLNPISQTFNPTNRQLALIRRANDIKTRYTDGEPLKGTDAKFIYAVLTNHPRATEKIGCGVRAIVVHPYIANSRAFFVIRTDGTVEDFSPRKIIANYWPGKSMTVRMMMASFPLKRVFHTWRHRTAVRVK